MFKTEWVKQIKSNGIFFNLYFDTITEQQQFTLRRREGSEGEALTEASIIQSVYSTGYKETETAREVGSSTAQVKYFTSLKSNKTKLLLICIVHVSGRERGGGDRIEGIDRMRVGEKEV